MNTAYEIFTPESWIFIFFPKILHISIFLNQVCPNLNIKEKNYLFPPFYVFDSNKFFGLLISNEPCHSKIPRTKILQWLIPLLHFNPTTQNQQTYQENKYTQDRWHRRIPKANRNDRRTNQNANSKTQKEKERKLRWEKIYRENSLPKA